jgi:hypothetical protein
MPIAARALLGIAGATLAPSTLSLISNIFLDPDQRQLSVAILELRHASCLPAEVIQLSERERAMMLGIVRQFEEAGGTSI